VFACFDVWRVCESLAALIEYSMNARAGRVGVLRARASPVSFDIIQLNVSDARRNAVHTPTWLFTLHQLCKVAAFL
jgi:hypothetical protein